MSALLEVKNLGVHFNDSDIIEGVSFSLEKGEVLSIIGPNGAGKTTLIRAILGLIPHEGHAYFEGQPITQNLSSIGYVPQRFDFDKTFPITVSEFLNLSSGFSSNDSIGKICKELEIEPLTNQKLGTLSGGQLQRVLIARAVINKPRLLIMDEPTAGVDLGGVKSFYDIVQYLNTKHEMAVMLISHEINMVYSLAGKVICLNKQMFCVGRPAEAITKEILDKLYGKGVGPKKHTHIN